MMDLRQYRQSQRLSERNLHKHLNKQRKNENMIYLFVYNFKKLSKNIKISPKEQVLPEYSLYKDLLYLNQPIYYFYLILSSLLLKDYLLSL